MFTVKNNTGDKFVAKYDGIEYVFAPGDSVVLTEDAAAHIFGLGASDKNEVLVRHGWLHKSSDYDVAMQKLNGFSFGSVNMVPVPDVTEVEQAQEQTEQGMSAPLQGEAINGAPDGVTVVVEPTYRRGSMLDNLKMA